MVCGDFNCISPEDGPDRNRLVEAFRSFSTDPEATVDRYIDSGQQAALIFVPIAASSANACARFSVDGRNWVTFTNVCNKNIMIKMTDGGGGACGGTGCSFGPLAPGGHTSWGALKGRISVTWQYW